MSSWKNSEKKKASMSPCIFKCSHFPPHLPDGHKMSGGVILFSEDPSARRSWRVYAHKQMVKRMGAQCRLLALHRGNCVVGGQLQQHPNVNTLNCFVMLPALCLGSVSCGFLANTRGTKRKSGYAIGLCRQL